MEKVAILNDIHGNLYLLNKALAYLRDKNISKYLICGDFLTDGPDDNKIIDILKTIPCEIILGNREESILNISPDLSNLNEKMYPLYYTYKNLTKENLKFIKNLPTSKIIEIGGHKICMSHGSPYKSRDLINDKSTNTFKNLIKDYPADIYLFAHTHEYFSTEYQNKLFLNSGAINCFIGKKCVTTFGIITLNDDLVLYEQVELPYDFDDVKDYYLKSKYYEEFPEWTNIVLYILKYGVNYNVKFSRSYDYSKSMKNNFYKFVFIYNLPKLIN